MPRRPLHVALIAAQFAAIVLLVQAYEIETPAFRRVLLLALGGFIVHRLIARRFRLRWFAVLSAASVLVALGVGAGTVVLALGCGLLAIAHLPVSLTARVILLVLCGAGLAAARAGAGSLDIPSAVWPVLASMFMFRLALYCYALRHNEAAFSPALALSYFFMMPNACFPLYPVVDYKRFADGVAGGGQPADFEIALRWMLRGVIHLLAYRIVYFDLEPRELFVYDFRQVVWHAFSVVLLYLKVSGQFHLIVGLLHLFGFRLPETHRRYFLATSIPDYWRRINIYWRDFMAKLVYYPSFFALRGHSRTVRLLLPTIAVFAVSWALHSYQVFWITGVPLLSWRDVTFWVVLATLMAFAVVRAPRARILPTTRGGWSVSRGASVMLTFTVLAVLWSFWTAESVGSWLFMWSRARESSAIDWAFLAVLLAGLFAIAGADWDGLVRANGRGAPAGVNAATRLAAVRVGAVLLLCGATVPAVSAVLPTELSPILAHLRGRGQPAPEVLLQIPAYYELVTRGTPESDGKRADPVTPRREPPAEEVFAGTSDFLLGALRPSVRIVLLGKPFRTNKAGLRDREYSLHKPPDTFRIALIGSSDVVGYGVGDTETFEAVVEQALDSLARTHGRRVELMNFGFPGWSIVQRALAIRLRVAPWNPDLVILAMYPHELPLFVGRQREAQARNISIPDAALADIVYRARLSPQLNERAAIARLRPLEEDLQRRTVELAAEEARQLGASLALLTLRLPGELGKGAFPMLRRSATTAGVPILDCAGLWDRWRETSWALSENDSHPTSEGHRRIARCLFQRLTANASTFPFQPTAR